MRRQTDARPAIILRARDGNLMTLWLRRVAPSLLHSRSQFQFCVGRAFGLARWFGSAHARKQISQCRLSPASCGKLARRFQNLRGKLRWDKGMQMHFPRLVKFLRSVWILIGLFEVGRCPRRRSAPHQISDSAPRLLFSSCLLLFAEPR